MKKARSFQVLIPMIDVLIVGLAAPIFAVIANLANLFTISLDEFWSTFVTWYIPADIFLASNLGICGFLYSTFIAAFMIIGAYNTWKGYFRGKILLFVTVLLNSIIQVLGLWAVLYYAEVNSGSISISSLLIGSRIVYSLLLSIGNLLIFIPRK